MKLIVELTNVNQIKRFSKLKNVKYLLINYKGLSLNYSNSFEDDELNNIKELAQKAKLGLVLNAERLFSDDDLHVVKELILKKFFDQFDYITYSDFGFKQLLSEDGYQEKLIFRAPTYLTNHQDVNLYNDLNAYVVLSSEISSQELIELSKQTNKNVIVDLFGQNVCFYSRRPLLTNYFIYRNIDKDASKSTYNVVEELRNDYLPIIEDETGTKILEPLNHCLCEEITKLMNIEYGIITLRNFKPSDAEAVVKAYNDLLDNENIESFYQTLTDHNIKVYKGAYNIKSVLLKGGASCE
ncbi:MAG: U32 family peptidase [Bacilli bacterium]|nr:U32 family peptidase [Bacilli bacterium]